jgi:hypothetical protein
VERSEREEVGGVFLVWGVEARLLKEFPISCPTVLGYSQPWGPGGDDELVMRVGEGGFGFDE